MERIKEVGDVWLDAGIVPFSTLGWQNPEWVDEGYATGAARGLTRADLPDHAYWEKWFPADWVTEMREQIRLWFYSQLFMSVVLTGRAPFRQVLGYEKMLDETGREMHGSWGNTISAEDAFARMGADVMRWQYCAQPPDRNLLFGFGPAEEIKRELLTFWNSVSFFVSYANIDGVPPVVVGARADGRPAAARPLARRAHARVRARGDGVRTSAFLTRRRDPRSTRRTSTISRTGTSAARGRASGTASEAALRTLWYALVQTLRVLAPVMPFLTEHLWRNLVPDGPESVHLAEWPDVAEPDAALLDEIARRAPRRHARASGARGVGAEAAAAAAAARRRGRVRRARARGARSRTRSASRTSSFDSVDAELRVKPNLPVLGPRLGKELRAVQQALQAGEFEELDDGRFRAAGHELEPDEVLVERGGREGWSVAAADGVTVALDLDARRRAAARGPRLRPDPAGEHDAQGRGPRADRPDRPHACRRAESELVERHGDWIKDEVLAVEIRVDGAADVSIAKAETGA